MPFRAFIAVDVDAPTRLADLKRGLGESGASLKLVDLENIHLTLKFLGDTDEGLVENIAEIMKSSIEGVEPFTMELAGTGVFPNPNYMKVIWVGLVNADPLVAVAKTLDNEISKLGFKREKRGFHPHITVARVKGPRKKNQLQQILKDYRDEVFGTQRVDCIKLKKSVLSREGPTYSTVEEVKFG
ncbi:MAG: RNA 2',3'-cyclic phosphodiesterase [Thermoplasmata archaeon]|nr:MAG: RNA 2',3'-cyclic phosphodiesterase [Thermoplasmata archaeon]